MEVLAADCALGCWSAGGKDVDRRGEREEEGEGCEGVMVASALVVAVVLSAEGGLSKVVPVGGTTEDSAGSCADSSTAWDTYIQRT